MHGNADRLAKPAAIVGALCLPLAVLGLFAWSQAPALGRALIAAGVIAKVISWLLVAYAAGLDLEEQRARR